VLELSTTDRLGLNTNRVLINIKTYVLDLNSYFWSWTMTTTWSSLVLGVVKEQGLRQGSGGFLSLAALRDKTSLKFRELTPTTTNHGGGRRR
jgi:hypothetical protein